MSSWLSTFVSGTLGCWVAILVNTTGLLPCLHIQQVHYLRVFWFPQSIRVCAASMNKTIELEHLVLLNLPLAVSADFPAASLLV